MSEEQEGTAEQKLTNQSPTESAGHWRLKIYDPYFWRVLEIWKVGKEYIPTASVIGIALSWGFIVGTYISLQANIEFLRQHNSSVIMFRTILMGVSGGIFCTTLWEALTYREVSRSISNKIIPNFNQLTKLSHQVDTLKIFWRFARLIRKRARLESGEN